MCNDMMQSIFSLLKVEHLVSSGLNHAPLLSIFKTGANNVIKVIKFHIFWIKEESFMEVIKQN